MFGVDPNSFLKMRVDPRIQRSVCLPPAGLLSCGGLTLHACLPQMFPSFIITTLAVFEPTLRCCSTPTSDPKSVEIFWDQSLRMCLTGRSVTVESAGSLDYWLFHEVIEAVAAAAFLLCL